MTSETDQGVNMFESDKQSCGFSTPNIFREYNFTAGAIIY